MGSFFNNLATTALTTAKTGLGSALERLATIDFDAEFAKMQTRMEAVSARLNEEIGSLTKHIHAYFDKWVVDMDFNMDEELITSNINKGDNTLSIKVVNEQTKAERNFTTTIPEDVDVNSLTQTYDDDTKKAVFTFKKKRLN